MLSLKVELGENSYPIYIGSDTLSQFGEMMQLYGFSGQAVIITDDNVGPVSADRMSSALTGYFQVMDVISVPPGEKSKSFEMLQSVLSRMLERAYDRNVIVIALGGGVVGDLAGFAASIYKRGVPYVQVPTTLLAQVDSSIGGKTGINHALGKNLIGTFYQPKMVWSDLSLLSTLPEAQIRCGLGEVIKHGVIRDAELFSTIESELDAIMSLEAELLQKIVLRCCEIKADVVAADEKEGGVRMILNFGHTVGHSIEAALGYDKLTHGEAVLAGMLAESKMALSAGLLSRPDFQRLESLVRRFDFLPGLKGLRREKIQQFMKFDKKFSQGRLRFVLPTQIGQVEIFDNIESKYVEEGIDFLLDG